MAWSPPSAWKPARWSTPARWSSAWPNPSDKDAVFSISEAAFRNKTAAKILKFVSVLSNPDLKAEGVVREISPVADPVTRTYMVRVTLKDPPPQLRFGMSVVGRLKLDTAPVVVLPLSAVFDKAGKPAIWVFATARQHGLAEARRGRPL